MELSGGVRIVDDSRVTGLGERQAPVTDHFQKDAPFWQDVYARSDVFSVIHKERAARAMAEVERLPLTKGSRVLEIGCGAGLLAIQLAQRGFVVEATDSTPAMVELTLQNAERAGLASRVHAGIADAHALEFDDSAFELVVAMGVLPWLPDPTLALNEMARVIRPGGFLVANIDNRARLTHLLDPLLNPALQPLRRALGHGRTSGAAAKTVWRRQFDRDLSGAGLRKIRHLTLGFGPFTFFARSTVRGEAAVRLHTRLQRLADHGVPGVRSTGAQYLVVAQKQ
ncbi:MAG TPA: class I SAM-dependent methyltransferase [Candidatus Limnocylindrales bacterium]|nr:class I SAM-dependent methyltransferase [Candidatus Limnocylindrales bacterium]